MIRDAVGNVTLSPREAEALRVLLADHSDDAMAAHGVDEDGVELLLELYAELDDNRPPVKRVHRLAPERPHLIRARE